jgi:hypothetical protein
VPDTGQVVARRHPHQVLIAVVLVSAGLPVVFGGPRPGSLSASLPGWLIAVWAVVLVVGGLMVIGAAVVRSALTALYLELAADLPLAFMCVVYAVSVWLVAGVRGFVPALFSFGFAAAFVVRGWQVQHALSRVRRRLVEEEERGGLG